MRRQKKWCKASDPFKCPADTGNELVVIKKFVDVLRCEVESQWKKHVVLGDSRLQSIFTKLSTQASAKP